MLLLRLAPVPSLRIARLGARGWAIALALGAAAPAGAVTGVCPDGSVFVVRRAADIPCSGARRVEPSQVPPLRPENLPRPYLWQIYQEKQSENNPYNLLERADKVRGGGVAVREGVPDSPAPAGEPAPAVAAARPSAPPPAAPHREELSLGLTDGELRDLFYLVELSQQSVPARFVDDAGGAEAIRVSFAHSQAFDTRLRQAGHLEGTALLFSVEPKQKQKFQPNFTFVQGQTAFHPQPGRARELDVLVGRIGGELASGDVVLGYTVLPPSIDISRPLDVYWDDRRIAATFR